MNYKRYFSAAVLLFVFIFLYEGIVHGIVLSGIYGETQHLWRDQMTSMLHFNILIQAVMAFWFTFIFVKFFPNGGVNNGLRFGLYLGGLSAIQATRSYYWLPISFKLAALWFVLYLVQTLASGALLGLVYCKQKAHRS